MNLSLYPVDSYYPKNLELSLVKLTDKSSFYQKVYDVAREIPEGRVTSYGAIARCLGTGMSARLVGWAMNNAGNQFPPVPAHRVVNRNGMLTGKHHFAYPEQMQELLEGEGLEIVNDQIKKFEDHFWDPCKEL